MRLEKMKKEDVSSVLALADSSVGKGLYREDDFLSVTGDKNKFLYVLKNEDGETAGYIYFLITSTSAIESSLPVKKGKLPSLDRVGRIQSVAVRDEYRGKRYAEFMINAAIEVFLEKKIDTVYIVCWNPGGTLPLGKALKSCGFKFVMSVKDAWYNNEALYCPYCGGRCHCSAALYMKKLIEGYFI